MFLDPIGRGAASHVIKVKSLKEKKEYAVKIIDK